MKKIAIYPGSFNPFHLGHLDVLIKAEKIFDEVIVAVGINPRKEVNDKANRAETLKFQLPGKNIEEYNGFLVDYVHEKEDNGYDVTIVRGLRNASDLEFEMTQLRILEDQYPQIKMVFLPCDRKFFHISSSAIRTMEKMQEGAASEYIVKPEMLEPKLCDKLSLKNQEIKVGDTTFSFELPKDFDEKLELKKNKKTFVDILREWDYLLDDKGFKQDFWSEHPLVPGYKFLNLCAVKTNFNTDDNEINIAFKYDKWRKIG